MKNFKLMIFLTIVGTIFLSSCAHEPLDYGHRVNYWNKRHPHDFKRQRYYYPKYNPDNRPLNNSKRY